MHAARYERKGPARKVLIVDELPIPTSGPGAVRVRVAVSAVNPTDTKSHRDRRGQSAMPFPRIRPHQDGAGLVDAGDPGLFPSPSPSSCSKTRSLPGWNVSGSETIAGFLSLSIFC
jgi:NADPH2:quinone reductase